MKTSQDYIQEILSKKQTSGGYTEYGSRVMEVLEIYKDIKTYTERKTFQDALEKLLSDKKEDIRKYAVDICLGFFVFRDAI